MVERFFTPALLAGGLIALLGLLPAIALTVGGGPQGAGPEGGSPQASVAAARIYTYYRITHHLLPADFRHQLVLASRLADRHHRLGSLAISQRCDPGIRRLGVFTIGAVRIAVMRARTRRAAFVLPRLGG